MSALAAVIEEICPVPELGQLVEVRRRQWVVAEVRPSSMGGRIQHLITLSSLDDDATGEFLSVIWEMEPGRTILESAGLPSIEGWDTGDKISAFLDAIRWGAAVNADRSFLQAPFRSGIQIKDYQLDPLVRAIDMTRVKLLIADDVGLGKTIEAGLVIQELIARHRARTVLIVVPASLQQKWWTEMHQRFGLEFRIVNTEYIKELRRERGIQANPWTSFPRLITSVDWMKTREGLRQMKDALPPHVTYPRKFDILVVDEAHNVSPSGTAKYALPSQRTQLIRTIAPHFEHRLFLSATPHNGYQESFTALLELLDDQRFARGVLPSEKQRQRAIVRRLKTDLPGFPERELHPLKVSYNDEELAAHNLLKQYVKLRSEETEGSAKFGTDFIHKLLKKRLFSSPRAFATTLARHRETLAGRRQKNKGALKERILRKAIQRSEEDYADDQKAEEAMGEAVTLASEASSTLTSEQTKLLDQLTSWANGARNRPDSKAKAILAWLDEYLKTAGKPNDKRVILFTEYRDSHSMLFEVLTAHDWGGDLLMQLHGGTDPDDREEIKAAFQADPEGSPVRILLATDAASEGIDLQNHCNYLIHYEIPWNPNVMEQRNGRIDRFGQKEDKVHIWHPVGRKLTTDNITPDSKPGDLDGDLEFLMVLARKVSQQRQDLGSLAPVMIKQAEEIMLGKRTELDTRDAEERAAKANRLVGAEKELKQKIERLHERLEQTRDDFRLTPERVHRAVTVALELAGKPPLQETSLPGLDDTVYEVPLLTGSWEQATEGLVYSHNGKRRPITFDHSIMDGREDKVVLAHLQHKLSQMCLRLLRAEVWAAEDTKVLNRVEVRKLPKGMVSEPQVIVWSRLVITGGTHHRLHEELTFAGGEVKANGFARERTLSRMEEMLDAAEAIEPSGKLFTLLQERFHAQKDKVLQAVEGRSRDRLQFLTNTLERRRESEVKDVQSVLTELKTMIETELAEASQPEQLEMEFTVEEREQLRRDTQALRARLERIPEELKEEVQNLNRRYLTPAERTFPVAVQFLVPEEML